jgi:iron complex outermembrane recepter protein
MVASLGNAAEVAGDQGDSAAGDALQEIVVTAQKRVQNLQEVGTSITAFDSRQLAQLGFTDTTDLVRQTPGLQFNQFSPSITVFNLRGVSQNDFSDHQEAPVAVYSDEAYVASMGGVAGSLFDLERVEILRGPQGTLFGRNATGGLVHYISKKPTDELNGYLQVTGGRFGQVNTEGAVGGPLTDRIDARLSFATSYHEGIITNRIGPDSENQKQAAARLQFLFKLADQGNFLLKLHAIHNDNEVATAYSWTAAVPNAQGLGTFVGPNDNPWGTCNGCDLGGYRNSSPDVFNQAYGRPGAGVFNRTLYGATGNLTWKLGSVGLTSITDYQHMSKQYGEDTDASPNLLFIYDTNQVYHQFSEELRLNGSVGPARWITGLYYLDLYSNDTANPTLADFLGGPSGNAYNVQTRSGAVFAQGEWDITDHWTGILGARYTYDRRTDHYVLYAPTPTDVIFTFNPSLYPNLARRTANLPTAKAEIDYKFDRENMLYASFNLGSKGGGFVQGSVPPAPAPQDMAFNPEKLLAYETGVKTTFLDGRARLNAAAFYYDYRDYQAYEQVGITQVIKNLQARIEGAEAELAIVPLHGLELQVGVSTLDTKIKNVTLPAGEVTDRVMPQAPRWSFNASARYQWTALGSTWSAEADAKTNSDMYFSTFNAPVDLEHGYTVANARLGWTSGDGKFDAALFCKNLMDRRYRIYDLDLSVIGFTTPVYGPPRWYGATIGYHFN